MAHRQVGKYTPGLQGDAETFDFSLLRKGFQKLTSASEEVSYQRLTVSVEDEDTGRVTTFTGRVTNLRVNLNQHYDDNWSPVDIVRRGVHWIELKGEWVKLNNSYYLETKSYHSPE